jgi:hypothetical protein
MTCDYFKDDTDDALLQISQINSKKSLTARNKPTEVVQYTEMTFCLILNEEFISVLPESCSITLHNNTFLLFGPQLVLLA